jgi:glycine/D-amino acid oxidase-like deaminating enzyme
VSHDVIIVGGGISGCAIANELADDHDVALLEQKQLAGEASGLAAGLCAPTLFYSELPDVARYANDYFRRVDGTGEFRFLERPRLELIRSQNAAAARERASRLADDGFPVSYIEAEAAAETYPEIDTSNFAGIVEYRDTGRVDPHTYTVSLGEAARKRGTDVEIGRTVTGIETENGRVTGVSTRSGDMAASAVVVAAGWRTADFVSEYVSIPVRPFKLQCAMLRDEDRLRSDFPIGRVPSEELYFRGETNGDLLVGGGEYFLDGETAARLASGADTDEEFRLDVASAVPGFMNGFENAKIVDSWSGVDAATPDTRPILDAPDAAPDGLVLSTGFNGLGMVNSGVAARAVRSLLTDEECPFPLEPFSLDRFSDTGVDFGLAGTFEAGGVSS